ncbi:hypothetical protein ACWCP6_01130 [Streptomyces sp. NPDC002004]
MGVIDRTWWGLWWPWMAVWLLTAGSVGVLVRYAAVRSGRRRRTGTRRTIPGLCFYLHAQRVMNLYKSGGFVAAVEQEVSDRTTVSRGGGVTGRSPVAEGRLDGSVVNETLTTYLRVITPITVIRLLMDTMRKEDVVVEADLTTGRLVPNRSLADSMREEGTDQVALSTITSEFVSVTGRFTARATSSGDVVLTAPYGEGMSAARVRITCLQAGIEEELQNEEYYEGEFEARCLGKVRTWNPEAGELTLDAVAIFR